MSDSFNMSDVFISYSRKDKAFVQKLDKAFKAQGKEVWVDWEDIPLTANWMSEIEAGIEAASAFVFVISPDSVASDICREEVEHAIQSNKRLIPLLYRDIEDKELQKQIHPSISSHNWIFFRESEDFDTAFANVIQSLETDLDYTRLHTRLMVRAKEWEEKGRDADFVLRGNDLSDAESWLASSANKEPQPSTLHSQYVLASRQAAVARQRLTFSVLAIGFVISILLTIATLFMFTEARRQREIAVQAQTLAERKAEVAASLSLAASAQQALSTDNLDLALVLALEAIKIEDPPWAALRALVDAAYVPGSRAVFKGHTNWLWDVAYSPDGQTVASASADGTIRIWNVESGETIHQFVLENNEAGKLEFNEVAYSPDGQTLMGVADDGGLYLWDVKTGEAKQKIQYNAELWTAAFSPDGTRAVTGSQDGNVSLWDLETGKEILRFGGDAPAHSASVWTVDYSPNGRYVLSGGQDNKLIIWDVETGEVVHSIEHDGWVLDGTFSHDGTRVATGGDNTLIIVWDSETGEEIQRLEGHTSSVNGLAFSNDDQTLLSGSWDNQMIVWDLESGEQLRRFTGHNGGITSVAFSPDNTLALSGSYDSDLRLWTVANPLIIQEMTAHEDSINGADFSSDGKWLISASSDSTLILWDTETGEPIRTFKGHDDRVDNVAFSPDDTMAISASSDKILILWDVATGNIIRRFGENGEGHTERVLNVVFSPDGKTAVSSGYDAQLIQWDIETGEIIRRFEGHKDRIDAVAFSPDGSQLLSGSRDLSIILWDVATGEKLQLWDVATGEKLQTMKGHTDTVLSVAFSPDGKTALSGSWDTTMRLWDLETSQEIRRFTGHTNGVHRVQFGTGEGNDGLVLSGSEDKSMRLWDLETGRERFRFDGHAAGLRIVLFHPTRPYLLSGARDHKLILWRMPLPPEQLVDWIHANRYIRELTCSEREFYQVEPLCESTTDNAS